MKKILLSMMAIFVLLSFNACSSENDPEPTKEPTTTITQETLFPEPYLNFNVSIGVIEREMANLFPNARKVDVNGAVGYVNLGTDKIKSMAYIVERGVVTSALMLVPISYTKELAEFLATKYTQIAHDSEMTTFVDKKKRLAIGLTHYISGLTPYWQVIYTPNY